MAAVNLPYASTVTDVMVLFCVPVVGPLCVATNELLASTFSESVPSPITIPPAVNELAPVPPLGTVKSSVSVSDLSVVAPATFNVPTCNTAAFAHCEIKLDFKFA